MDIRSPAFLTTHCTSGIPGQNRKKQRTDCILYEGSIDFQCTLPEENTKYVRSCPFIMLQTKKAGGGDWGEGATPPPEAE